MSVFQGRTAQRLIYIEHVLESILSIVTTLQKQGATIMATLADITAAVAAEKTVEDSVLALLTNVEQQLTAALANGNDPAAIQAVVDQINANKQTMADAVAAGTPAQPVDPNTPAPAPLNPAIPTPVGS